MASICLYFQVHQPRRLRKFQAFDIGQDVDYFADYTDGVSVSNPEVLNKVAKKCYLPANQLFLELLQEHPELKITYSITGIVLRQLQEQLPHVLDSFKALAATGQVEFLGETYYHSLSSIFSEEEFVDQIDQHSDLIKELFGQKPNVFRNTELIYNNQVAKVAKEMGFKGTLAEGADRVLEWRTPNFVYAAPSGIPLLLKNYQLSDDIAFRFSHTNWEHHPLTAEKYAGWLAETGQKGEIINLFMDYETFGEHHWEEHGIFDFLADLPKQILKDKKAEFVTASEAVTRYEPKEVLDVPAHTSWADDNRDLSAWLDNDMQKHATHKIYSLRDRVLATDDDELIDTWRHLQTSDHFYYMCTKWAGDGHVHAYFSPFESPYTAFLSYMNVVQDFELKLEALESMQSQLAQEEEQQQVIVPAAALNVQV